MLKFYYGTKLEELANQLFDELKRDKLQPLAEEIFVVQNHGIGQWLSLRMAQQEGVAANLKFEFPSERIWSLIRSLDSNVPQTLPSDRGPMTWTLMQLFKDQQFLDQFVNLRYYIEEEDLEQRSMRSWKLASKIADVFDQYLIYRPQMILEWEQEELYTQNIESEKWQRHLWNRLVHYWEQNCNGDYLHRARLLQDLWKAFDKKQVSIEDLPERISVFGISTASPAFIKTMVKLSNYVDVSFYQLSVDPAVTKSEKFSHPLLQSLGKQGAKFMAMANDAANVPFEFIAGNSDEPTTLLQGVQADLRDDRIKKGKETVDHSLQVHNCHSPMREVEVLYDQLLNLLDNDSSLNPDDILIMTPDIDTYAPLIEAVFGTPEEGQPNIPYAIADRSVGGGHPATETFLAILSVCEGRFKVTEVLDLLDNDPIQQQFSFSDDDLNRIEQWVADNRIRWGVDSADKQQMGLPKSDHFTWKAGLRRILLGYMMHPSQDRLYDGVFAYREVESSEDSDLAGRLSTFLNKLFEINNEITQVHEVVKWQQLFDKVVEFFLPGNRDYFWEINAIRTKIESLAKNSEIVGFSDPVPFTIIRRWITDQLENDSAGGGRIGRGVTFSSLMPMRSIPFKMIGMLGMNEEAFPQSKIPIEFDLMHLDPQAGDPVQSDEQRYLFLENLLSARAYLYFSYVGQSNRQDANFPPSVVLKEFLDFIKDQYAIDSNELVTRHPLQAFSPKYFTNKKLFSYSETQKKVSKKLVDHKANAESFLTTPLPQPDEEWKQLSINDLVRFFQHPAKFLIQNRLGIYLQEQQVITEDREPFILKGFDNYQVGQELLDRFFDDESLEDYQDNVQSRDLLPEGWSGDQAFNRRLTEVKEFGNNVKKVLDQQKLENLTVDMNIDGFRIIGNLSNIYEKARISYRLGSMRPKDIIEGWIKHLLFQGVKPNNHPSISRLFARDNNKGFVEYALAPVEDYESPLKELLALYWQGLRENSFFFPESGFAYAETVCYKDEEPESGLQKAAQKWVRDYGSYPGEGEDDYNKLLVGREDPLENERFRTTAEAVWGPMFEVLIAGGR